MKNYYYAQGNDQCGPVTLEQLISNGIKRETLVWYQGLPEWIPAKDIPEIEQLLPPLIASAPIIPPPLPNQSTFAAPKIEQTKPTLTIVKEKDPGSIIRWGFVFVGSLVLMLIFFFLADYSSSLNPSPYNPPDPTDPITQTDQTNPTAKTDPKDKTDQKVIVKSPNEWMKYVKVGVRYRPIYLGGVRDVEVTVVNNWISTIDEAAIIISYEKENGDLYKSEIVYLYDIQPGKGKTISAVGSNRGVKAFVYFGSVTAKDAGLNYTQPDS